MEDEIPTIANEDGSCVACNDPATTTIEKDASKPGDTDDAKMERWRVCARHAELDNAGRQDKTDTSSVKEKSDADASDKEPFVGETGKCELVGYGDFTPKMLDEIMIRADDLARQSSSRLWRHAFMNLAADADYLQELYKRQLVTPITCALERCDNLISRVLVASFGGDGEIVTHICAECTEKYGFLMNNQVNIQKGEVSVVVEGAAEEKTG